MYFLVLPIVKLLDPILWVVAALFMFISASTATWLRVISAAFIAASLAEIILNMNSAFRTMEHSLVSWIYSFVATALIASLFFILTKKQRTKSTDNQE